MARGSHRHGRSPSSKKKSPDYTPLSDDKRQRYAKYIENSRRRPTRSARVDTSETDSRPLIILCFILAGIALCTFYVVTRI